jgi:hypothetical protein
VAAPPASAAPAASWAASQAANQAVNQPANRAAPDGLLLKDATLEDIVRFLQARHIEPTFRFLTPQ